VVKNLTEVFVPILWCEATLDLSPYLLKVLKIVLQGPLLVCSVIFFVVVFFCMVSVGVSAFTFIKKKKQNCLKISSNDQLVNHETTSQPPVIPVTNQSY